MRKVGSNPSLTTFFNDNNEQQNQSIIPTATIGLSRKQRGSNLIDTLPLADGDETIISLRDLDFDDIDVEGLVSVDMKELGPTSLSSSSSHVSKGTSTTSNSNNQEQRTERRRRRLMTRCNSNDELGTSSCHVNRDFGASTTASTTNQDSSSKDNSKERRSRVRGGTRRSRSERSLTGLDKKKAVKTRRRMTKAGSLRSLNVDSDNDGFAKVQIATDKQGYFRGRLQRSNSNRSLKSLISEDDEVAAEELDTSKRKPRIVPTRTGSLRSLGSCLDKAERNEEEENKPRRRRRVLRRAGSHGSLNRLTEDDDRGVTSSMSSRRSRRSRSRDPSLKTTKSSSSRKLRSSSMGEVNRLTQNDDRAIYRKRKPKMTRSGSLNDLRDPDNDEQPSTTSNVVDANSRRRGMRRGGNSRRNLNGGSRHGDDHDDIPRNSQRRRRNGMNRSLSGSNLNDDRTESSFVGVTISYTKHDDEANSNNTTNRRRRLSGDRNNSRTSTRGSSSSSDRRRNIMRKVRSLTSLDTLG